MNRAQITDPTGGIDHERTAPPPRGVAHAPITVREWNAHYRRHRVVYEGCMRFEEVRRLGAPAVAEPPHGLPDSDLPIAMTGA